MVLAAGYLLAFLTGMLMGLIGAGGGILSTTILVYLFGITPELTASYTLLNVSIISLAGSVSYFRKKLVDFRTGLFFAIPSLILVVCMRKWIMPAIPEDIFQFQHLVFTKNLLILLVFALLMIVISYNMIFAAAPIAVKNDSLTSPLKLLVLGSMVAVVTGFAGIGGGFIIVPALVYFAKLDMKMAIGTSLFIIFVNTTMGFFSDFSTGIVFDWGFVFGFVGITLAGMLISSRFSKFVKSRQLKKVFGISIFIIGCWIIIKEFLFRRH